jgi:phosphoribosylamine--glycine ligase
MRVMILGSGGREHAMGWGVSRSPQVQEVFMAPGNGGTSNVGRSVPLDICDPPAVLKAAKDLGVDLVIVGPEAPLVAGVADPLLDAGIRVLGPGSKGAQLEGSKAFAKAFMTDNSVRTAQFDVCSNVRECRRALSIRRPPYVIKADGLAAGKGVLITQDLDEAIRYCEDLIERGILGDAGSKVVVEDHIGGFEITALAMVDGDRGIILPLSQDHKRAYEGDRGPNTGGMGAYCPVPWEREELLSKIRGEVLEPTLRGLKAMGIRYRGILYMGLMVRDDGSIWVLEYNVRMGDPETQVTIPVIGDQWLSLCWKAADGRLDVDRVVEDHKTALGVVLASEGYPARPITGRHIQGADPFDDGTSLVFHSGTRLESGGLVSSGGRVLTVVGIGEDLKEARERAYDRIRRIHLQGGFYRSDIGLRAMGEV